MNYTVFPVCYRLGIIKNTPSSSNIDYEGKKNLLYFDVDYITGADLFIKKTVADSYGLFDADFFMYWEETEMQFRYMKHGCRRIIINGPRIVHLEGGSNRLNSPSKKTRIMRSYFLYLKKTTTKFNFIFYITTFKAFYLLFNIISYPFINGSFAKKYKHIVDIVKMKV